MQLVIHNRQSSKMKARLSIIFFLLCIGWLDNSFFVRCEDTAIVDVDVNDNSFQLHFMYLVQTRNDRISDQLLSKIENFILHKIQRTQNWNTENEVSTITEINSSPSDSINKIGEYLNSVVNTEG
jgi:hypothetical protein